MSSLSHQAMWDAWRTAMAGERMHHAWLLAGKAGLGKANFALSAARELVAEQSVTQPVQDHPDILVLSHPPKDEKEAKKRDEGKPYERKRNIPVGAVRAMQTRLHTRPTLGGRRAIIVNPADDLEKSASNALLKSLEEPPQGTFFLLVSHRPARLLPTIRSRCRLLRFPDLSPEEIEQFVSQKAPEATSHARAQAVAGAGGSAGAAMRFLDQDLGPVAAAMQSLIAEGDPTFNLRTKLASAIGPRPDRERVQASLELARNLLASQILDAPRPRQAAIIVAHSELVALAGQAPTYNFDAGLMVMELGSLLAHVAKASERANA